MMNKKGQTLIAFVIILPVFILFLAFIVDTGILLKEKSRLNGSTKSILENMYPKRNESNFQEQTIDLFKKNKIPTENLNLEVKNNTIIVSNDYEIESIFGKIIGIKKYKIHLNLTFQIEQDKLTIKKE
ncbi:MAG: pilus assembly protein [Bacilli bacterium]|nr:pilus assembly protein [Bacilli bacterium]